MRQHIAPLAAAVFATAMVATGAAFAETIALSGELSGTSEVPPNDSAGTGAVEASYDTETKTLTYQATYEGLTGPAIGMHFHGPADPGANAGIAVPFLFVATPAKGKATLSDAQEADLLAGKWYLNVHTAAHPGGEIRGQVTR